MKDQRDPEILGTQIHAIMRLHNLSILEAADYIDNRLISESQAPSPAQEGWPIPAVANGLLSSPGSWPEGRPRRLFEEDGA